MSILIKVDPLRRFTEDIFKACGSSAEEAFIVADHLVTSNLMGYDTHGIIRIPQYVEDVRKGTIVPHGQITTQAETATTAIVEAAWNFGQVGGMRAIELAIIKAAEHNTASVVVRRSNHAGRLGAYTQYAAERGFIALGFCNSPIHGHFVLPWGGKLGRLATNPVSFSVPTDWGFPMLADFSTAETSEGGVRLYRNLDQKLPEGWIVDAEGEPSRNPADFYGPPRGAILPFGGKKGYRGFALSLLVEILGGLLAGSPTTQPQPGNGLAFIVINPDAFLERTEFLALMAELRDYMKSTPPSPGSEEVLMPGEPDYRTQKRRQVKGIPIDDETRRQVLNAAMSLGVDGAILEDDTSEGDREVASVPSGMPGKEAR